VACDVSAFVDVDVGEEHLVELAADRVGGCDVGGLCVCGEGERVLEVGVGEFVLAVGCGQSLIDVSERLTSTVRALVNGTKSVSLAR
jgi:hypothetical protein